MPKIEPLNSNYDEEKVVEAISVALSEFYTSLTNKLNKIKLKDILKKKNPYLYRAKGINDATMVINRILSAYISSSEETIFGNTFFEPIAIVVSGGQKAVTEGVDITVDKDNTIYSIAVESGTSVFNADSRKRQEQNFQSAQRRAQQAHKAFMLSLIHISLTGRNSSCRGCSPSCWRWRWGSSPAISWRCPTAWPRAFCSFNGRSTRRSTR